LKLKLIVVNFFKGKPFFSKEWPKKVP